MSSSASSVRRCRRWPAPLPLTLPGFVQALSNVLVTFSLVTQGLQKFTMAPSCVAHFPQWCMRIKGLGYRLCRFCVLLLGPTICPRLCLKTPLFFHQAGDSQPTKKVSVRGSKQCMNACAKYGRWRVCFGPMSVEEGWTTEL